MDKKLFLDYLEKKREIQGRAASETKDVNSRGILLGRYNLLTDLIKTVEEAF